MGNKPHHSGHYGGGRDLSKGKTPQDADIKVMPIINRASSYKMGMSMRGPLDKNIKVNSWEEEDVKRGKKQMAEGHKGHAEALFDDAHGSWNWSKSHHSTGAEPKMTGPLNQTQQSGFRAMTKEEIAKLKGEEVAKQGASEALAESTNQLKTNMEKKITKKKSKKA